MIDVDLSAVNIEKVRGCCCRVLPLTLYECISTPEVLSRLTNKLNEIIDVTNALPEYIEQLIIEYLTGGPLGDLFGEILRKYFLTVKNPPNKVKPAVGDGTEDDTEAFQECLNYASKNDLVVLVPAGKYLIQPLTFGENASLVGFGKYSTELVLKGGSTSHMITGVVKNGSIKDLTINGNSGNQVNDLDGISVSCNNAQFENLVITRCYTGLLIEKTGGLIELNNIQYNECVDSNLVIGGTEGFLKASDMEFNGLSGNGTVALITDANGDNFEGISFSGNNPVAVQCDGNNNYFHGRIISAVKDYENNGTNNTFVFVTKDAVESWSGNKTENITGTRTINAKDIVLNPTNPLTYRTPTPITDEISFVPAKDASGTEYKIMVDNGMFWRLGFAVDTTTELVSSNIKPGNRVSTKGYLNVGDGGEATYLITSSLPTGYVLDNGSCFKLNNGNYAVILLKDKVFNVNQFGAIASRSLDDYSDMIQKALDYCSLIAGHVIFPKGTYPIVGFYNPTPGEPSNEVYISSDSHVTLSEGAVIKCTTDYGNFTMFDHRTPHPGYTGFSNILLDGKGSIEGGALRLGHNNQVTVRDITLRGWTNFHACEIAGCSNVLFENVKFVGAVYSAVSNDDALQIEHCSEINSWGTLPYDGTPSINITVNNCLFANEGNNNLNLAIGTHLYRGAYTVKAYTNIKITNCSFLNMQDYTFEFADIDGLVISDCYFYGCKNRVFTGYGSDTPSGEWTVNNGIFSNNTIINCGVVGENIYSPVIYTDHCSNFSVIGNMIKGCTQTPICSAATAETVSIVGNVLEDNNTADTSTYQNSVIAVEGASTVDVVGNTIMSRNVNTSKMIDTQGREAGGINITGNIVTQYGPLSPETIAFTQNNGWNTLASGEFAFGEIATAKDYRCFDYLWIEYQIHGSSVLKGAFVKPMQLGSGVNATLNATSVGSNNDLNSEMQVNFNAGVIKITSNVASVVAWTDNVPTRSYISASSATPVDQAIKITKIIGYSGTNYYNKV